MTWKKVKRKKLLSQPIKNGSSPICSDVPTGKWVLGLGALDGNGLDVTQAKPAHVADKRVDEFLLQSGDFLVSRSNTLDKVGRSALFKGQIANCSYPDLMMRFRVHVSKIHPEFLEIFLRSPRAVRHFQRFASGTRASLVKINKKAVEDLSVSIPLLFEQTAIADLLSIWDAAIEKIERLIEAREKRLSSLIQKMISSRCENWEHLQTKKIFRTVSEKKNSHEKLLSVTQDRGVIPRAMLNGCVMSPEGSTEGYKLIKKGDFAISLRSFQGGIEYSEYQGLISPAYTVLRSSLKIHDKFYRHFFKSYLFIEKYISIAVIGIRDGKQISIPDFMTVKIPYPPIEDQKQIASTLNTTRQEIDLLKKQAEAFRKQKRGLIQKLLTGRWRVKVAQ